MWPYHPDLLATPVPRYTSFPTAAEFDERVGAGMQADRLARVAGPVSLYVHIPYCEAICWYCGCNTGVAGRAARLDAYLEALDAEIDLVAAALPAGLPITRIAFGGGSPNAIAPLAFIRLLDRVTTAFGVRDAAISIELDPRGMTDAWADVLGRAGVTHASLGVQTFSPALQAAIGRVQPLERIVATTRALRAAGVGSLNFDLMHGLPGQSRDDLRDTLARTIDLGADRVALFGYAHVPHLVPRQRRIDAGLLPDTRARFAFAELGHSVLTRAGYEPVGFDHFARPDDGLARAARDGTLRRNFQGFTDDPAETLIGLGASAISLFPDAIVQNEKNAGRYRMRLSQRQLTGARGVLRSRDDRERALVIEDLLCGRPADVALFMGEPAVAGALPRLAADGLVSRDGPRLVPTALATPYLRAIAALFDPYRALSPQRFSSAI